MSIKQNKDRSLSYLKGLFFPLALIGAFFIIFGINPYLIEIIIEPYGYIIIGVMLILPFSYV